jgi:hypothetical protein
MVRLIGKIMERDEGDFILECNGESPLIIKKNGKIQVNHEYDDGTHFPFDELRLPVEIIRIPCQ